MMTMSNVKPNGKYLVVDDASGLIVSAIFDRINGMVVLNSSQVNTELCAGRARKNLCILRC
jgi:hypothetical protein